MRVLRAFLLLACVLTLFTGALPLAADDAESDCAICHEEVVAAFQRTGHAAAPGWDPATGCQACHGPGEAHIDGGGDLDAIIRPQLQSPRQSSDGCLSCHQRHESHFSGRQSIHRLNEVGCISCHAPHSAAHAMLREPGAKLCADCHQATAAQFELPRSHPMAEGGPGCVECHDPHGKRSLRSMRGAGNRTCGSCHFEKAGPFVYDHGMMVDGCAACHEVHASTNRHLLRHESQVNLCYECHSAGLTPGWHNTARFVNEKCTACHAAIHGSNTSQFFLEE